MKEDLKAPLWTLIKTVVSALIVFGSSIIGQWLGSDPTIACLGASIGTAVLVG